MSFLLRRIFSGILTVLIIFSMTACGDEAQDETGRYIVFEFGGENIYLDEVYIYAQTTIDEFEQEYGSDIWEESIETEGGIEMKASEMARQQVISNIVQTKVLAAQAESYGITLTAEEEEEQQAKADDFYNSLTDEQIEAYGMEEETVTDVLSENALAEKVYDYVMSDTSSDVSDEQARMTTFYDMFFECYYEDDFGNIVVYSADKIEEQKEKAEQAYESIVEQLEDNPDLNITFLGYTNNLEYAGSHTMSKDEIVSTYGQKVLDLLYSMENGNISEVVETDYGYHIFQMTYLTDEEATAEYKEQLTEEAQTAYYENLLSSWTTEIDEDYTYSGRVNTEVYSMIEFE